MLAIECVRDLTASRLRHEGAESNHRARDPLRLLAPEAMGLRPLFHRPAVEAGPGTRASPENDGQEESDQGEEKHPTSLSIAGTDLGRFSFARATILARSEPFGCAVDPNRPVQFIACAHGLTQTTRLATTTAPPNLR